MKEIKVLMFVNVLCVSAMMAFLSVIGPIIRELNMQEWHAGLIVSLAGVIWMLLSRYWGRKSDIVGRKPILIIGVGGLAVAYLLLAIFIDFALLSPPAVIISLGVLLLTRGAIGAFFAAITPVSNALIADCVEESKRTPYIAKLGASSGIGMILGPILGGLLAVYGLSTPLYVFAALPFLSLIVLFFVLPSEKIKETKDMPMLKIFDIRLRLPMLAAFLTIFSVVTSQVCIGFFVLDRLGFDPIQSAKITGLILGCVGIMFIFANIFVTKTKLTPYSLIAFGSIITSVGYAIVVMINSQLILMAGFCLIGFGMGMIFPAFQTLAVNLVKEEEKGAASGTVSAAQGLGIVVGPIVSTTLYSINPTAPFILVAVVFALLAAISLKYKNSD
jgi:MFS family permease